jgi:4a-hydroxytetrahydrobiopterin dehydratase
MLSKQNCAAVQKGETAISEKDAKAMLGQLGGWALAHGGKAIFRKYSFPDFDSALLLANKIAEIAQKENHHPDISFGWGYVKVRLMTHDAGGLHKNDFIVAAKINEIQ